MLRGIAFLFSTAEGTFSKRRWPACQWTPYLNNDDWDELDFSTRGFVAREALKQQSSESDVDYCKRRETYAQSDEEKKEWRWKGYRAREAAGEWIDSEMEIRSEIIQDRHNNPNLATSIVGGSASLVGGVFTKPQEMVAYALTFGGDSEMLNLAVAEARKAGNPDAYWGWFETMNGPGSARYYDEANDPNRIIGDPLVEITTDPWMWLIAGGLVSKAPVAARTLTITEKMGGWSLAPAKYASGASANLPGLSKGGPAFGKYGAEAFAYAQADDAAKALAKTEPITFALEETGTTLKVAKNGVAPANTGRLVHLTNAEAGAGINSSGTLIGNNYAGPLSNAGSSGLGVTWRTGLSPSAYEVAVPIPRAAQGAFSPVRPIGPISGWQYVTGQQYTARGVLDLSTGTFTRQGVNWNQALIYTFDAGFDATAVGGSIYVGSGLFGGRNEKK